ncbi:Hypothetical predicted protein [Lecanosticta acicola]|uniref:Uncharacterized protein n=1 Tax=Lecanosticta acicola TaxID=111012 RepID=A0AAI8YVZ5_9PEZI|nr:Hypothetical predicted protein [Lecanosticta acicola]
MSWLPRTPQSSGALNLNPEQQLANSAIPTHHTMASICHRCAVRLRHAAQAAPTRAFSTTPAAQRAVPAFTESPNPELNELFSLIRTKLFLPNYLDRRERNLIFKEKYRQMLLDNPPTVEMGDEEFTLEPLDKRRDLPARCPTVRKALDIMMEKDSKDWHQLPTLMQGLKQGLNKPLRLETQEKIIRKAVHADQMGVILQCLETPERTGMDLKRDGVRRTLLYGLRELAQKKDWHRKATDKALRNANLVSRLLESEEHGGGRNLKENDPRTRPETVGIFLELAAVYAYRHAGAKDDTGLVKAYAERLTSCLERASVEPHGLNLVKRTKASEDRVSTHARQWPMLSAIPIWHGIFLAQKILGEDMPNNAIATKAIADYETRLNALAAELESDEPTPYGQEALAAWRACIRD